MLTVLKSEVENSNILKLRKDSQGNGRFATDSQDCPLMSFSDPSTGTFHQTRVIADDTACSVNGVLQETVFLSFQKKKKFFVL